MNNLNDFSDVFATIRILAEDKNLCNSMKEQLSYRHIFSLTNDLEKIFLHEFVKRLPENSNIVEIGSYLGASAAIMAHSRPDANIYSYDLFDSGPYTYFHDALMYGALGRNKSRTYENVKNSMSEYPKVVFRQVTSENPRWWDQDNNIDVLIEDGNHRNPVLEESLSFWSSRIKTHGFLILHDYRPWLDKNHELYWPDVISAVDNLKKSLFFKYIGKCSSLAVFQKKDLS